MQKGFYPFETDLGHYSQTQIWKDFLIRKWENGWIYL